MGLGIPLTMEHSSGSLSGESKTSMTPSAAVRESSRLRGTPGGVLPVVSITVGASSDTGVSTSVSSWTGEKTGLGGGSLRNTCWLMGLLDALVPLETLSGLVSGGFFLRALTDDFFTVAETGRDDVCSWVVRVGGGRASAGGSAVTDALFFFLPRRPPFGAMVTTQRSLLKVHKTDTGPQGRNQTGSLNLQACSQIVDFQSRPRTVTKLSRRPLAKQYGPGTKRLTQQVGRSMNRERGSKRSPSPGCTGQQQSTGSVNLHTWSKLNGRHSNH
jgi:hypothetical protein